MVDTVKCDVGVFDCDYDGAKFSECADYNGDYEEPQVRHGLRPAKRARGDLR